MATQTRPAPPSVRSVGTPQGMTLVASTWVAVFASAALLGPVLPRMTEHFSKAPHVDFLIAFIATLPSLFVALLSIPFGILADRAGHRRVMFWACVLYGVAGILPYWLESLTPIAISRGLVGIAAAAIMTCGAALIGDYFVGSRRDRWFALQAGTAQLVALVAVVLGGTLGEANWHEPFLVYGYGFVLAILVGTLPRAPEHGEKFNPGTRMRAAANWPLLWRICGTTLFSMSAFFVPVIQTGFLLTERGIASPRLIGLWQGVASLANPLGALAFGVFRGRHISKTALSFALMAAGFGVMGLGHSWQAAVAGALIANFGCGIILPTLLTWALSEQPAGLRGRSAGAYMGARFLGQFVSPFTVVWLKGMTGNLSHAVFCYAAASAIAAAGATSRIFRS